MASLDLGALAAPSARPLVWTAAVHAAVAVVCALLLLRDAPPITGAHPAAKPLTFAAAIAILRSTLALVVPRLSVSSPRWSWRSPGGRSSAASCGLRRP